MDTNQQDQVKTEQSRFTKWGRNAGLITAAVIALYLTLQGLIFVGEYSILICFIVYFVSPILFVVFGTILGWLIGKFKTTQSSFARILLLILITLLSFVFVSFIVPIFLDLLG